MRQGGRFLLWFVCSVLAAGSGGEPEARAPYTVNLLEPHGFSVDLDVDGIPDAWGLIRTEGYRAFPDSVHLEEGVLRLWMNGRSVGVETMFAIPVRPDSAYRVEGLVRSEGLRKGTPLLEFRWADESGRERGRGSRPLEPGASWAPFRFETGEIPPDARSLSLRLAAQGREVEGRVWFKEVVLFRRPRLTLDGLPLGHLYDPPAAASLTAGLGGVDAGAYRLCAELRDLEGNLMWQEAKDLALPAGASRIPLECPLPVPGHFRLLLALHDGEGEIVRLETGLSAFAELPELPVSERVRLPEGGGIGIRVSPSADAMSRQSRLLERLSPTLAAVDLDLAKGKGGESWGANPADLLLRRLIRKEIRCVGLLGALPEGLEDADAALKRVLLRYWGEVDAWALPLGPGQGLGSLETRWKRIVPWLEAFPREILWGVHGVGVPPPGRLTPPFRFLLAGEGEAGEGKEVWTFLPLPEDEGRLGLREFALKAARTALGGRCLFLPLEGAGGLLDVDGALRPESCAVRTLSHVFRSAQGRGEVPLDPEVEAYTLDREGATLLLAWTRVPGSRVHLRFPAQGPVTTIDLMGRSSVQEPRMGQVELVVDDLPRAFLAISQEWLRTRRSMRLDGPVKAAASGVRRKLQFENGFSEPLAGMLRLSPPSGWRVLPEAFPVSLAPGEAFSEDLTLIPSPYEITGPEGSREKTMLAELAFAEGAPGQLVVSIPFRFESEALVSTLSTRYQREGDLIQVLQQISNRGSVPVVCDAFLSSRGGGEIRKPLGSLEPGGYRSVEYVIPWREVAKGDPVVGVRETAGERRFATSGLRGE